MNTRLSLEAFTLNKTALWSEYEELIKKSKKDISSTKRLRDLYPNLVAHYTFLVKHYPESVHKKRIANYLHQARRLLNAPVKNSQANPFYKLFSLYLQKIPQQIYQYRRLFFISILFFWCSIIASFVLTIYIPEFGSSFLGTANYYHYKSEVESGIKFQNFFLTNSSGPVVFITVFINNLKVSILALLGGMFFGLGTVYILIKNAFIVGGLLGIYYQSDYFLDFVSTIFQHGFLELMAIALSGMAGFLIASPYFFSGHIQKKDLFRKRARQAIILFTGVITLLFVAGFIEGMITILNLSIPLRLGVIAVTVISFIIYLIYSLRHSYSL